jgi:site-specific DNA-methyltransferase (adenine-specific)
MDHMKDISDKYYDLAIIDPPYRDQNENAPTKDMRNNRFVKGQGLGKKYTKDQFIETCRISRNQIIWGANNFEFLPSYKGFIVWKKITISEKFTMSMAEIAYISEELGTVSKVIEYAPQGVKGDPRIHPTQKPVALYKWLLQNYAKPGQKIFDSHVGSGSIRIACHDLGFYFVGCELDLDYHAAQEARYQAHIAQSELFGKDEIQKLVFKEDI